MILKHSHLYLKTALFAVLLSNTPLSWANNPTNNKAIKISEALIQYYGTIHKPNIDQKVKLQALIHDIPEAEVRKKFADEIKNNPTIYDLMLADVKNEMRAKDLELMKSALKRQTTIQSAIYASCVVSGQVSTLPSEIKVPLSCKVPERDLDEVISFTPNPKNTSIQEFVRYATELEKAYKQTPKVVFQTTILLHKDGDLLLPESDDPQYFPSSVTDRFSGTTEEQLMKDNEMQDLAP